MNAQDSIAEVFDVFLCHNSEDKPAVREIWQKLVKEGIKPWLDDMEIRPGTSWQTALEQQIENIKSAAIFVGESGVGPWQRPEIQAFLNQFVKRECSVIPVVLDSVKTTPKLPLLLENLHYVDFRETHVDPLKKLIWGITGEKPAELSYVPASENPVTVPETVKGRLLEPSGDDQIAKKRLYERCAEPPDREQAVQLEILRRRVTEYWMDGVLRHSLYNEVLISLGKRQIDQFVDAPWKYTVEVSDAVSSGPLVNRDVSAIYDATGWLLILGEPGSGKSTTLLDLARTLLDRAEKDIRERVPIVLNLSSWKKKQSLAEWISFELSEKYRVPRKIARLWLQRHYLIPLLDGLDEVQTSTQPDCVAAINAFIAESNPSGLVVCCRLNEYRWLPERLKLNGAICIEPLGEAEIDEYLGGVGVELETLRHAIKTDSVIKDLSETPLMLNIMSLAFHGSSSDELIGHKIDSHEERRKQIFSLYVEQMFQRKGMTSLAFPKGKIIGWLSWLATKMKEHSQSVFLIEELQPSWLGSKTKRAPYGAVVALSLWTPVGLIFGLIGLIAGLHGHVIFGLFVGLITGLIFGLPILVGVGFGCWSESPLKNGIMSGSLAGLLVGLSGLILGQSDRPSDESFSWPLIALMSAPGYGLIVGLIGGIGIGSLNHITLVETMSWEWNQFWKKTIRGSIVGLIFGVILTLILFPCYLLFGDIPRLQELQTPVLILALILALITGLIGGLIYGFIFGLVNGLIGGFTDKVKVGKASPNQGTKMSLKNSLAVFLITSLPVGLVGGVIAGLNTKECLFAGLGVGLGGLFVGLSGGLNRGGAAVIKHYALRLILWLRGYTPFNFVKFLDQCARLILLKKVGGGYIFIHRMLLEYFAEMAPESKRLEVGAKASK